MNSQDIKKKIAKLPDSPGVYFFLGAPKPGEGGKPKILYIGKATSLRDRVRSYFNGHITETRGPLIAKMLSEFTDIKFQKTDSVLEALILEANLVRKHQPEANTDLKDDKSFNYVVITDEDFPRVLTVRGRELKNTFKEPIKYSFGPFTNGSQLKEATKLVRRIFPFRDNKCIPGQGRPCFNRQIGLCPGVCTGEISRRDYARQVRNIVLFFEGRKKTLLKNLEKQMKSFAKDREFEKAAAVRKTVFALGHIQDISLIKESAQKIDLGEGKTFRIESYDVAHLSGKDMVGVMTVVEDGEAKKSDYRKFSARGGSAFGGKTVLGDSKANDTAALSEIISRRLNHREWPLPDLVVVDGGLIQKRAAEKILAEAGFNITVAAVVKDEKHRPREILGGREKHQYESEILLANAEAHRFAISFHRRLRSHSFKV